MAAVMLPLASLMRSVRKVGAAGQPAVSGSSALALQAAGMVSGDWADFTMGGLDATLVDAGGSRSILEYCARGHWDPVHKVLQFWGQGHQQNNKLLTWDDATNTASAVADGAYDGNGTNIGHAYYHQALNPATGDVYVRRYGSLTCHKKPYGAAWTTAASMNSPPEFLQVAGALEWFTSANSGSGGLVFLNVGNGVAESSVQVSNAAVTSWSTQATNMTGLDAYAGWAAQCGSYMYFGGGAGNLSAHKMDASGTVTAAPDTPLAGGTPWEAEGRHPIVQGPDGASLYQFEYASSGAIHKFNGTSWSSVDTHSIGHAHAWAFVPISDYGVILFIGQTPANTGAVSCKVYKV